MWRCPKCKRAFTRKNQRHACGIGDRSEVLRGRPKPLVDLYSSFESYAKSLGAVEVVTRKRYALFRSTCIFADLVMMTDAVRAVVHLARRVEHPMFIKVGADRKRFSHVAMLRTQDEFDAVKPFLREAYERSILEH